MVSENNSHKVNHWTKTVPPISTISALDSVVRLGTFASAAEELNRTPSAISHAIREFETKIGVPLFIRKGKRVSLSELGKAYIEDLQVAITALKRSNRTLSLHRDEPNLRVSAPPLFVATVLIPHIADFEARFRPIKLTIETTNQLVEFDSSDIDIAIRFASETNPSLYCEEQPDLFTVPVCSSAYAKTLHDGFENAALIQSTQIPGAWERYLSRTGQAAPSEDQIIEFDSTVSALEAARHGLGVMLGIYPMVCAYPGFGTDLVALPKAAITYPQAYRLVCRRASKDLPKVRAFSTWMQGTVKTMTEKYAYVVQ